MIPIMIPIMIPWNQATMVHFSPWLRQNPSLYNKPAHKKKHKKRLYALMGIKPLSDLEHPQRSKNPITLSSLSFLWVSITISIYFTRHQSYSKYTTALTLPWDTATAVSLYSRVSWVINGLAGLGTLTPETSCKLQGTEISVPWPVALVAEVTWVMDMLLSPIRWLAEVDLGHSVALSGRLVRFYSQTLYQGKRRLPCLLPDHSMCNHLQ